MAEEQTPEVKEEVPFEQPAPRISSEEQLIQSAAEGIDDADDQPARVVTPATTGKKSHKKLIFAFVVIILILVGVGAYLALKKNNPKVSSVTVSQQKEEEATAKEAALSFIPENVAYAYRASDSDPYTIYYRPAIGGERKEVKTLVRDEYLFRTDARGSKIALSTSNGLYTSTDSGKTYKKVVTVKNSEQITGVRIATSGLKLIYGVTSDLKSNDVKTIDFDGANSADVMNVDVGSVLIYGWNDSKNELFYSKGCAGCDGSPSSYRIYNTKSKTDKELTLLDASKKSNYTQQVAVSDDFSTISIISASAETGNDVALSAGVAPYTVGSYDIANSKLSQVTTVGTKGEKNANGTAKVRTLSTGFLAGSNTLYYTDGTSIFKYLASKSVLMYKPGLDILGVEFASDKTIILNTGQDTSDALLSNFDITSKKSTQIFVGDNNTQVIGVTTK